MSLDTQLDKLPVPLRLAYIAHLPEIRRFQRIGHELREKERLKPLVEHNAVSREMHAVEWECLKVLCPDLNSRDGKVRLKAMRWVCNQDWGRDFRASPYDKVYFSGHDVNNAAHAS